MNLTNGETSSEGTVVICRGNSTDPLFTGTINNIDSICASWIFTLFSEYIGKKYPIKKLLFLNTQPLDLTSKDVFCVGCSPVDYLQIASIARWVYIIDHRKTKKYECSGSKNI